LELLGFPPKGAEASLLLGAFDLSFWSSRQRSLMRGLLPSRRTAAGGGLERQKIAGAWVKEAFRTIRKEEKKGKKKKSVLWQSCCREAFLGSAQTPGRAGGKKWMSHRTSSRQDNVLGLNGEQGVR
jgi:hypothetical protein